MCPGGIVKFDGKSATTVKTSTGLALARQLTLISTMVVVTRQNMASPVLAAMEVTKFQLLLKKQLELETEKVAMQQI